MKNNSLLDKVKTLLTTPTLNLPKDQLKLYVSSFIDRSEAFLNLAGSSDLPAYVLDPASLTLAANQFSDTANKTFRNVSLFYAIKSNYHPVILKHLADLGYGLDVSSGEELNRAIKAGSKHIIFSGPGKRDDELELACSHSDIVTVLIDSFQELQRIEHIAAQKQVLMRAGVRLTVEDKGLWRKFGISLDQLNDFFVQSESCEHVDLAGLQYHTSWNLDCSKHEEFLKRLGKTMSNLSAEYIEKIQFLDVGGGFWPEAGEWLHASSTPKGRLEQCIHSDPLYRTEHCLNSAQPLEPFMNRLSQAVDRYIRPLKDINIYMEPGRWISHSSMHFLVKVIDKKSDDLVIIDAGTNAVGWERYEFDYVPVINLTRPGLMEHACMLYGSLCTPHDIWGYYYFGQDIKIGDVLLVPDQGAYTYSLRQNFIKPLPSEAVL